MEVIKNIIEYLSIIIAVTLLVIMTYRLVNVLQQGHYHYSNFYLVFKYHYYRRGLFLIPLIMLFWMNLWYVQLIFILYGTFISFYLFIKKPIVELKITARICRLFFTLFIVTTVMGTLLHYWFLLPELVSSALILYIILPLLICISFFINYPLEISITKYYQQLAKKKLKKYNTNVIGISGSFGKTSTKSFLYCFLKETEMTMATPQSYNTLNGVSLSINEWLLPVYYYFIAEMGASRSGDIRKLNKLLSPKYGIITAIGPQHLKTFKSIDNVIDEKMQLINNLPKEGIGVINIDDENIRNYNLTTQAKIVTFGINEKADYQAFNINTSVKGLHFRIKHQQGETDVSTQVLGFHNIYNILAAFAMAMELGVSKEEIVFQTSVLEPIKNRLSIRKERGFTILDDSFNSNYNGFINALDVLKKYKNPRILITPGIVDLGKMEKAINTSLANRISEVCHFVVLIKSKPAKQIKDGLDAIFYKKYIVVANYKKAIAYVKTMHKNGTILIENDIGDIYKI